MYVDQAYRLLQILNTPENLEVIAMNLNSVVQDSVPEDQSAESIQVLAQIFSSIASIPLELDEMVNSVENVYIIIICTIFYSTIDYNRPCTNSRQAPGLEARISKGSVCRVSIKFIYHF